MFPPLWFFLLFFVGYEYEYTVQFTSGVCFIMIRVVRSLLSVRGTGWGWLTKAMFVQFYGRRAAAWLGRIHSFSLAEVGGNVSGPATEVGAAG